MPYPTPDEFREIISATPLEEVVNTHVFQGVPFVFRTAPAVDAKLVEHLSGSLKVDAGHVIVVGSARIGFSLNPTNFPRPFGDESDIDVAIVDSRLFDEIWLTLLRWHYPRRIAGLPSADKGWAAERRKDIYWGWLTPDRIRYEGLSLPDALRPLRDISASWFSAFRSLSLFEEFAAREVSGRLYRSWSHVAQYQIDGLRQIRDRVTEEGAAE